MNEARTHAVDKRRTYRSRERPGPPNEANPLRPATEGNAAPDGEAADTGPMPPQESGNYAKDPSAPDPPAEKRRPQGTRPVRSRPPPTEKAPAQEPSLLRDISFLLLKVAAIVLAFMLLFTFMYGLHRGVEPSMKPAIQDGDLVMYYRLDKTYVSRDVLLLEYQGQTQARRVVAVAGDVVDITEDGLVINGALQQELDIYERTERYAEGVAFPLTVGEGQVFVLADARTGATDSRVYGAVDVDDTLGKVITILRRRNI